MRPFSVRPLLLTAILLLAASSASAATTPAEIFGDSMVLQRDKPAPVWGWAEPGEKVTVSFAGQSKSAVAGDDGKWMVVLNPLKLSTQRQTLTIAGKEKVELHDVLVGDVWLCSGQSNMGRSVERSLIPDGMKWEHPSIRYSGIGRVAKYPVERYGHEEPRPWMICQKQFNCLRLVPNSGMAVLLDLDVNVHPVNKVDSGVRLAFWALNKDYGKKNVVFSGPLYRDHTIDGSRVIVEFDHTQGGLRIGEKQLLAPPTLKDSGELDNWELLGADGKNWHPAVAKLDGERVIVTSKDVPAPTEVRYCYTTIPKGPFLYNAAGLPAAMFTTKETK